MKISAMATPSNAVGEAPVPGTDQQPSVSQRIRSLKMTTQVTPQSNEQGPPANAGAIIANSALSNSAISKDTTAEANEDTQPLSPQYAQLLKQKRALQVKERELVDREKALSAQPSTQEGMIDLARLKEKPLSVLLEAGVTYQQLTDEILANNQGGMSPERIQSMLDKKEKELEERFNTKLTDRDNQSKQQALEEMKRDALFKIQKDPDAYELVKANKAVPQVMAFIERTYDETGEIVDVKDALDLFEEEYLADALKIASYKKIQNKLAPPMTQPQARQGMRTLSNRDTASVPLDRKQRAMAAFYGTLK